LVVVLAIAGILVALAYSSSRSLVTQTKVSQVREEHRSIARALSNYMIDHSTTPDSLRFLATSPSYISTLPSDPFLPKAKSGYLFLASRNPDMPSVLVSAGPDGDYDLPAALMRFVDVGTLAPPVRRSVSALTGGAEPPSSFSQTDLAILTTYLYLGAYDPNHGPDGDIVTLVR
jgi:type II secretory pathway pseudopilin PulG